VGSNPTEPATIQTHSVLSNGIPIETVVKIQQHKLWLESQGYRPKTIKSSISNLKTLAKHSYIIDPESVKKEIASRNVSDGTKEKLVIAYNRFCKQHSIKWDKPRYRRTEKIPYVPTENDIDQLIGGMSSRLGTILLFIKETGCRLGEMWTIKWDDIRPEKSLVVINQPEKGSKARIIRVSARLMSLVLRQPRKTEYVFRLKDEAKSDRILSYYWQKRKEIADKTNNSNLMKINFKSLRHFKATREYYQTKDILHVKELLGHRNIKNTLIYTHLCEFEESDQFIVKVAKDLDEFTDLLSKGFNYISDFEGMKVLRKRK